MSFAFATVGIVTTIYIYVFNASLVQMHVPMLLIFYTLMEILQGIQYYYVNQCSNVVNVALNEVAYIFGIVQPFLWNYFFYLNSDSCDKKIFICAMFLAVCWATMSVIQRLLYRPDNGISKQYSWFGGSQSCTRKKNTHLFWEWPRANLGEMNATYFTNLLIWFGPALITAKHRMTSIILILSSILGVIAAWLGGEVYVFASAWCFVSIPIVLAVVFSSTMK